MHAVHVTWLQISLFNKKSLEKLKKTYNSKKFHIWKYSILVSGEELNEIAKRSCYILFIYDFS